ncbi:hypothetical protein GGQ85_003982 [Nitrobacter vulgaris]|nr:hypothetical protein [Nitrobacter vulgaris]
MLRGSIIIAAAGAASAIVAFPSASESTRTDDINWDIYSVL